MSWIIKGEAGKTLDTTARAFADLNISGCVLKFQSLAGDQLTWTAEAADATGAGTLVPDMGQIVELWWDTTRKFRGHVTGIRVGMKQIQITIDGPWWWMERTNLTEVMADATGVSAERHSYVFPLQSLATDISSLMARAVTNGVPMTAGSVAAMYTVPQMTLTEQSVANALALLMAWCPDSVAWFDYSGSGAPTLNVTRRGVMATQTYTLATDAVEIGDISPRMDLEVARNEIHYVVRNTTTGKPAWASQASGTAAAGKRQIVTVSGPEIVDFLPKDDFASYALKAVSLLTVFNGGNEALFDPVIADIFNTYGTSYYFLAPVTYFCTRTSPTPLGTSKSYYYPGYSCKDAKGVVLAPGSYYYVTDANPPEWVKSQGIAVTLSQHYLMFEPASPQGRSDGFTAWAEGAVITGALYLDGWGSTIYYFAVREAKGTGWAIPNALGVKTGTTIYKPWEYDFAVPPAGLAAELVAAQAWVPWEGPITLATDECSGDNLLPKKYRLANALAPCATMDALARGVTHDLMRGRTTIDLGAPARVDFGTLVSRVRTEPKDNIIYL